MSDDASQSATQRTGKDLFAGDRNDVVERAYATEDVAQTRAGMVAALAVQPGETVIEIGSGPGFMTVDLARAAGTDGHVLAIDISDGMVAMTARRCADAGCANVETAVGDAAHLEDVTDGAFDVASVGQVLEYMTDPMAAVLETARVLRPGGRAAFLDIDWGTLIWHAEDAARLTRVVAAAQAFRPEPLIARRIPDMLTRAGFELTAADALVTVNTDFGEDRLGRWMFELMRQSAPETGHVTAAEVEAVHAELSDLSARGAYYYSVNRCLFVARKSGA